jgi:hypothetical protein
LFCVRVQKVDLYSAGAILFEMLAGRPPFMGADVPDLIANQRRELKMPVRVSPPCLDVISCLLQRQPAKRASAQKLAEHPWVAHDKDYGANLFLAADQGAGAAEAPPPLLLPHSPLASLPTPLPPLSELPPPPGDVGSHHRSRDRVAIAGTTSSSGSRSGDLSASVAVSGWELVPSKSAAVAEALRQKARAKQTELLLALSRVDEGAEAEGDCAADLQGVREVMEYSRRAAEHFGACNRDDEVAAVLEQLQKFLKHPRVDAALARSALPAGPPPHNDKPTAALPAAPQAAPAGGGGGSRSDGKGGGGNGVCGSPPQAPVVASTAEKDANGNIQQGWNYLIPQKK